VRSYDPNKVYLHCNKLNVAVKTYHSSTFILLKCFFFIPYFSTVNPYKRLQRNKTLKRIQIIIIKITGKKKPPLSGGLLKA